MVYLSRHVIRIRITSPRIISSTSNHWPAVPSNNSTEHFKSGNNLIIVEISQGMIRVFSKTIRGRNQTLKSTRSFCNYEYVRWLGTDSSPVAQNDGVVENSDACRLVKGRTLFSLADLV